MFFFAQEKLNSCCNYIIEMYFREKKKNYRDKYISVVQIKLNLNVIENRIVLFSKEKLLRGTLFHSFYLSQKSNSDPWIMNIVLCGSNIIPRYMGFHDSLCINSRLTTYAKWKLKHYLSHASISRSCAKAVCAFEIQIALIKIFFFFFFWNQFNIWRCRRANLFYKR